MIKVDELEGQMLDYWVAKAEGMCPMEWPFEEFQKRIWFHPTTDWARAGKIIEREKISVMWDEAMERWHAYKAGPTFPEDSIEHGPSPLIAAMRCFVSKKFEGQSE